MSNLSEWYTIQNIDELDSPALVIYPDRVKENIRILKSMVGSPDRLRPHVKTHKTREAAQLMIEAGITKFKCATIAEAEMLGIAGAADVLLAYQPVHTKLVRFMTLTKNYPGTAYSCLVDNTASATMISETALAAGLIIDCYLDLNVGMNRTGIVPSEGAAELYEFCSGLKGLRVQGLHAYDGHIHDPELEVRRKETEEGYAQVESLVSVLKDKGYTPHIIAGGSPSFPFHAARKDVDCSPGTFIFWDKGYQDSCAEQPFLPAALVIARVISLPSKTTLCLDLGHKSIAAENPLNRRVVFLNAPELKMVGQSEEHLVVDAGLDHSWKVGDVLYGIPIHICPTVALYDFATTVENGVAKGTWEIVGRDRKIKV
jgi:D-serine deaminase-like pyridoxal phosphate-dependent protein